MRITGTWSIVVIVFLGTSLSCFSDNVSAGTLSLTVTDASGSPVSNAVISAYAQGKPDDLTAVPRKTVVIDQIDKKFVDHVTPVQVGTAISFPNHDQIRHHVYSFSSAKTFEIPLYKGVPSEPIVFKQEGIVTLGCNIHDWMSAYIVVIDSPYFATTDEKGHASLTLPVGDYELHFWHRDAEGQQANNKQSIKIVAGEVPQISVKLSLKPPSFKGRGPLSIFNRGRYR